MPFKPRRKTIWKPIYRARASTWLFDLSPRPQLNQFSVFPSKDTNTPPTPSSPRLPLEAPSNKIPIFVWNFHQILKSMRDNLIFQD